MMATKPKTSPTVTTTPSQPTSSEDAAEDLERRLLAIGGSVPADMITMKPPVVPVMASAASSKTEINGGKNALLARIMAAQERSKIAQQKQKETEAQFSAMSDQERKMKESSGKPEDANASPNDVSIPPLVSNVTPQPFEATQQQLLGVTSPPPPFAATPESGTMTVRPSTVTTLPMPSIDLLDPSSQTASAPSSSLLDGIENNLPTHAATMPEESAEQPQNEVEDDAGFDFNIDGVQMTAEERNSMMEEQRRIMEQIQKESAGNTAAIAAAAAEGFESRSGTAAAAAVPPAMEIPSVASTSASPPLPVEAASGAAVSADERGGLNSRTVEIGGGQQVALHGQDRTKAAIASGTAILVQCINCENWMQVTESATLMFCPVCNVVSPVQKQSQVVTKDEAIQLSNDRKLAEQLQKEFDEQSRPRRPRQQQQQQDESGSWWDAFSSLVSFGVEGQQNASTTRPEAPRAAQIGEGSSNTTAPNIEREGLLGSGPASSSLPSARVAERQPLFSCVVDSVSNAATALGTSFTARTLAEDSDGNVHGVDSSSLLVSQMGREGGESGGNYRAVPNSD